MLRAIEVLSRYRVVSSDQGVIGSLCDFYFDVEHWAIRYLATTSGSNLAERKRNAVVSPMAVIAANWKRRHIITNLPLHRVRDAPASNWDQPLSRHDEIAFNRYYGYPAYWRRSGAWAGMAYPAEFARTASDEDPNAGTGGRNACRLRSATDLEGYRVISVDRAVGYISGFAVDDHTWVIKYLMVDTASTVQRHRVLIAPEWADTISWHYSTVHLDVSSEQIERSPRFSGSEVTSLLDHRVRADHEKAQLAGSHEGSRPTRLRAIRWHQEKGR